MERPGATPAITKPQMLKSRSVSPKAILSARQTVTVNFRQYRLGFTQLCLK